MFIRAVIVRMDGGYRNEKPTGARGRRKKKNGKFIGQVFQLLFAIEISLPPLDEGNWWSIEVLGSKLLALNRI